MCRSNTTSLFSVLGATYASVLFLGIRNATNVQPLVAVERTIFYRERAAGMYSAIPYAIAQVSARSSETTHWAPNVQFLLENSRFR